VNKIGTILWLGHDNSTYTYFTHITTFKCELFQTIQSDLQKRKRQQHDLEELE
jgi:hypothetical protein